MAQGPDHLNQNLEELAQIRKMVDDRLKTAGKELEIVQQIVSDYDQAQAAKGEKGFRLERGADYYVQLCKLADAQILSGLDQDIERLELELMRSKRQQLEEMTKRMAQMVQETSPYNQLVERERLEKIQLERLEKERLEKIRLEKLEKERLEKIRLEKLEKERLEKELLEKERLEKQEKERKEKRQKAIQSLRKIQRLG